MEETEELSALLKTSSVIELSDGTDDDDDVVDGSQAEEPEESAEAELG
jgi:hypothetical protein